MGATPQISAASIVFDDSSRPRPICNGTPPTSCSTGNLFGGETPAQTFYQAMNQFLGGQPVLPLPPTDPRYVTGGNRLSVPQEIGQPLDQATSDLRDAGFVVATSTVDSRAPAGTVVGQTPAGGSGQAIQGQTITLVSSTGKVAAPPAPPAS